jgi:2-polyprenyl-3-methyl-5-hydroxy-6-metoxy-1,4-benzoquinol methylase
MPKKPYYESAIHHLLLQAKIIANQERISNPGIYKEWELFVNSFQFEYISPDTIQVIWTYPSRGKHTFSIKPVTYYTRGDTALFRTEQTKKHLTFSDDKIKASNDKYFRSVVLSLAKKAHISIHRKTKRTSDDLAKIEDEEELSNIWALNTNDTDIDVVKTNTAATSPELRYIHSQLGDVTNKRILDLGSGLGEVSIYFALKGAHVTAVDLSLPMLQVTQRLAKRYKVKVKTVQATVEELSGKLNETYDIVYVGNLFHHVQIPKTIQGIKKILKKNGILVCWEPVHYNPIINIYRNIAKNVRSHDERPFTYEDIDIFTSEFRSVRMK